MSPDGQGAKWRTKIAENFNRLSRVHERYRQTTDRQTNGRHVASSRSLKQPTNVGIVNRKGLVTFAEACQT